MDKKYYCALAAVAVICTMSLLAPQDAGAVTAYHYFSNVSQPNGTMSMSQSETKYIRDLAKKNKSLKVLFNPERYPLSYYQGGAAKGVLVDIFKQIASEYDLPYQFVKAGSIDEYYQLRDDKKADIILDFVESTDEAEVLGYRLTSPYAGSNCSVITKKSFTGTPATAAVIKGSEAFEAIADDQNEQVKIINYDSFSDCIKAVKSGKADCTYTYSLTAQMYILTDHNDKLKASQLNDNSFQFRMAVNSKTDMLPKESDFFIPGLARFPLLTGDVNSIDYSKSPLAHGRRLVVERRQ